MELSSCGEAASCAATQQHPNIFMELEDSSPYSQERFSGPHPEPD
jgi:hypothetical protein